MAIVVAGDVVAAGRADLGSIDLEVTVPPAPLPVDRIGLSRVNTHDKRKIRSDQDPSHRSSLTPLAWHASGRVLFGPRYDRSRTASRFLLDWHRHVATLAFAVHELEGD